MRLITLVVATLLAACSGDSTEPPARWSLLEQGRASSLLSVWGDSATNVWVAGADERDGSGPTVLHYDGTAWTRVQTGETTGDLWWVFGVGDSVFFGGSKGALFRYRAGAFEKLATPNTNTVFGIWGSAANDIWAVGGLPGGTGAFVWRYDGSTVTAVPDLPAELAFGTVWKVNGCAANDVWMSCTSSITLHYDGNTIVREDVGTQADQSLFSVGCMHDRVVVAGGNTTNGVLYERDGGTWSSHAPTIDGPLLRGVAVTADDAYAVGQFGAVLHRDNGTWVSDPHGLTQESLHAAWIDPDSGLWAVGGKFDRAVPNDGVLIYKGTADVPPLP